MFNSHSGGSSASSLDLFVQPFASVDPEVGVEYELDSVGSFSFSHIAGSTIRKRFYRLHWRDTALVLCKVPITGVSSEEYFLDNQPSKCTQAQIFIEVACAFSKVFPEFATVHYSDPSTGLIILDDLGDKSLFAIITQNGVTEPILKLFEKMLSFIVRFQKSEDILPPKFIGRSRQFGYHSLWAEIEEFLNFGLKIYYGVPSEDIAIFETDLKKLALQIGSVQTSVVHRDLQSKNLMVLPGEAGLSIIDAQDAAIGPWLYDVASLVYDPYVNLSCNVKESLARLFWESQKLVHLPWEDYLFELKMTAIQRFELSPF